MATFKNTAGTGPNPEARAKPRLNVLRGYPGNETAALSRSLSPKVAIQSGQAVVDNGSGEWILALNTHTNVGKIHIAYHDSTDTDVISCGKLLAFSVVGRYELETGYTKADAFAAGDPVYVDTVAGQLTKTKNGAAEIIGYASAALVDWSKPQYGTGAAPYAKDNMAQNTEATAANSKVLRFSTAG
jgi:hypothetical protein